MNFLISDFVLQDAKKIFCKCLSKLSQASVLKMFHFSDQWKEVSMAPQRGCTMPLYSEVFFQTFWQRQVKHFTWTLETTSSLLTELGVHKLSDTLSKFDVVISLPKYRNCFETL